MSALSQIQGTLSGIARTGSLINRVAKMHDEDDTLRDVVNFINATVLPRCLHVTLSDHTLVRFGARNRRLEYYTISTGCDPHLQSDFTAQPVLCTSQDGAGIALALRSLCAGKAIVHKRIRDDLSMPAQAMPGVSALTIQRAISAEDPSARPLDLEAQLSKLVELAPDQILGAMVVHAEDLVAIIGTDQQLFAMLDWAKSAFGEHIPLKYPSGSSLTVGGWCAIEWGEPASGTLIVVRAPEQLGLILCDGAEEYLMSNWIRIISHR